MNNNTHTTAKMVACELGGKALNFRRATFEKWVEANGYEQIDRFELMADFAAIQQYGKNARFFVDHGISDERVLFGQVVNRLNSSCLTPRIQFTLK